ncbi:alpha/beta fold hydrolase [Pseudarthrobacter sp. NPDC092419]|uniref:alpha/beta fold hydrolase n=1 Tax=Pseudarthrobacter sp. NPDC092419 TaxID=3364414 RepID=UPI0038038B09
MVKQRVVFVHGAGSFGAAAWPRQHGMALAYDALFLRRLGYGPAAGTAEPSLGGDAAIILRALQDDGGASGGHVVAHAQGAIPAMLAAVERPDLVHSLVLVEPACLSLTADLPATAAHRAQFRDCAEAPLHIVPGVPTLVLTGGWEPLFEEIAGYLRETGAVHRTAAGGHRPHDSVEGDRTIRRFIAGVSRGQTAQAS